MVSIKMGALQFKDDVNWILKEAPETPCRPFLWNADSPITPGLQGPGGNGMSIFKRLAGEVTEMGGRCPFHQMLWGWNRALAPPSHSGRSRGRYRIPQLGEVTSFSQELHQQRVQGEGMGTPRHRAWRCDRSPLEKKPGKSWGVKSDWGDNPLSVSAGMTSPLRPHFLISKMSITVPNFPSELWDWR